MKLDDLTRRGIVYKGIEQFHDGPRVVIGTHQRIAIVGSRDFKDLDKVREYVRGLDPTCTVVSGRARGVDRTAEEEAKKRGLKTDIYPADWNTLGRAAGMIRNKDIVDNSDQIVAFYDGFSRGTMNTISYAERVGKRLTIIREGEDYEDRK